MGLVDTGFSNGRLSALNAIPFDLPANDTKRWVPRRKAQVVAAVRAGVLTLDEACSRYALTVEEYLTWQRAVDRYGLAGLRTTHAQEYRDSLR